MRTQSQASYDIIGDVHGHLELLLRLLDVLGYREHHGVWRHPEGRRAVFVGDLIDRGPRQVACVRTVRAMVEDGSALCCLGNHEFNAICYALRLRELSPTDPHHTFLSEAPAGSAIYRECLRFFLTLPVWLELEGCTVVHACFDPPSIACLSEAGVTQSHCLDRAFYSFALHGKWAPEGTLECRAYHALDTLLKGREIALPSPYTFTDNDGRERSRMRIRWWDDQAETYAELAFQPGVTTIPARRLTERVPTFVPEKPTFIGHYWLHYGRHPEPLSPLLVCVDYSAGHGGPLVAYRWEGTRENALSAEDFVACFPEDV